MNFKKHTLSVFAAVTMAGLAASAHATEVTTHDIKEFKPTAPNASYTR